MAIALIVIFASAIVLLLFLTLSNIWDSDVLAVLALCVGGAGILTGVIMFIAQPLDVHFSRVACAKFARYSGREVQFKVWNGGYSTQCYVRTSDGKWLPKGQLRDVAP